MEEEFTCHQPEDYQNISDAEVELIKEYVEPRRQAAKGLKTLKRERDDFEAERPDLARYFDEFGDFGPEIGDVERIKICRAYASYLASIQAPKPSVQKKSARGKK